MINFKTSSMRPAFRKLVRTLKEAKSADADKGKLITYDLELKSIQRDLLAPEDVTDRSKALLRAEAKRRSGM